jgi:hypothetical protein
MGMNGKERIEKWSEEEILTADGFEDAIVGLARRSGLVTVAYDVNKMLQIMVDGGLTPDEAREYFEFNVVDAWMGDNTPVYIEDYKVFKDVEAKIIENDNTREPAQDPVEPEEGDTGGGSNGEDVQDKPVHE